MASSPKLTRKEWFRMYKQIDDKKKKNIRMGKDECDDLPHQDKIKSHASKTKKKENEANKKRKASLDSQQVKYKKAAKHSFARLLDASDYMDEWADLEPAKKKSRKDVKDRSATLEEAQKSVLEKVDLKWECRVTYNTPKTWKIGDLSVCKKKMLSIILMP